MLLFIALHYGHGILVYLSYLYSIVLHCEITHVINIMYNISHITDKRSEHVKQASPANDGASSLPPSLIAVALEQQRLGNLNPLSSEFANGSKISVLDFINTASHQFPWDSNSSSTSSVASAYNDPNEVIDILGVIDRHTIRSTLKKDEKESPSRNETPIRAIGNVPAAANTRISDNLENALDRFINNIASAFGNLLDSIATQFQVMPILTFLALSATAYFLASLLIVRNLAFPFFSGFLGWRKRRSLDSMHVSDKYLALSERKTNNIITMTEELPKMCI